MPPTHALFESASGYAIFEVKLTDDIALKSKAMQDSLKDLSKFGKIVSLLSFSPTKTTVVLAVSDSALASSIKAELKIPCDVSDEAQEIIRGIRLHASKLLKGLQSDDLIKAQLGLGTPTHAIALLDQLDKDVNLFSMRIREWYGYHFPELVKLVPDNQQYASIAQFIGDKDTLNEEKLPDLAALLGDDTTIAQNISMLPIDMLNINTFAGRVVSLSEYRKSLISYLSEKMNLVAPSLTALLGERVGARLISHAGSLTNLSKYPASTVQILGAEKALFRALKTKGNTPKYGLLYHSSFIGRAGPKFKGRISRFLANKCSIASRIDCYSDVPTAKYGEALRAQVEERLNFFETGAPPSKNADVIHKVMQDLALEDNDHDVEMGDPNSGPALTTLEATVTTKEKKKKRGSEEMDVDEEDEHTVKKVKLSKEEKKALKKAKKEKAKEGGECLRPKLAPRKRKRRAKRRRKKRKQEGERGLASRLIMLQLYIVVVQKQVRNLSACVRLLQGLKFGKRSLKKDDASCSQPGMAARGSCSPCAWLEMICERACVTTFLRRPQSKYIHRSSNSKPPGGVSRAGARRLLSKRRPSRCKAGYDANLGLAKEQRCVDENNLTCS
ncbi:snoRNP complex protein [Salix suchowensis]|nr:snoRNP complex protein [Salix suchowensis]